MSQLLLELRDGRTQYRPGEVIDGIASWELGEQPRCVEVRLYWYTHGRGARDLNVIDHIAFEKPATVDSQIFSFMLPRGPYSFKGTLVNLQWAVELVVLPDEETQYLDFVLQPDEKPVVLHQSAK